MGKHTHSLVFHPALIVYNEGLSDKAAFSFKSMSAKFKGQYIVTNGKVAGHCQYGKPCSDAVLRTIVSGSDLASATWLAVKKTPPPPTTPYQPWLVVNSSTATGNAAFDGDAFHGERWKRGR